MKSRCAIAIMTMVCGLGCELSQNCEGLVYDEDNNTCVCPLGSEPDYELDACVLPNGEVIPWNDLPVPYLRDSGPDDVGLTDAGMDGSPSHDGGQTDLGSSDLGPDGLDGGANVDLGAPPPPTLARYPWNGLSTGSVHVLDDAPIIDHPLRPKLVWEPIEEAEHYQVQMTRECGTTDFHFCPFTDVELDRTTTATTFRPDESLSVRPSAPVGSRYFWRVRSCAELGCSDWTDVRYLDVGRSERDFNGDGYADLVVGNGNIDAPEHDEGNVYVFFGQSDGVESAPSHVLDNPTDQLDSFFGNAVAAADVNADGFADLIVGAASYDAPELDEGSVFIYFGSASGLPVWPSVAIDHPSNARFGGLGASVAGAGDVDGDGFGDLVVGAESFGLAGEAFVFYGDRGAPLARFLQLQAIGDSVTNFGDQVGGAADLNGDGYADIAVGATAALRAFVYFGGPEMSRDPAVTLSGPTLFGSVLVMRDIDADGFGDLLVGADGTDGGVFAFFGGMDGPVSDFDWKLDSPTVRAGARFGGAMAVGDFDGNGNSTLIVGAMFEHAPASSEGAAYIYRISPGETPMGPPTVVNSPTTQALGYFGEGMSAIGDVNGDGYEDFAIGAWGQSAPEEAEGNVFIYLGGPVVPTVPSITIDNPADQPYSRFGVHIAVCCDQTFSLHVA